jgi:NTE family protein/lysophospholipid hydrolase
LNNTQFKILSLSTPFKNLDNGALEIVAEKCIITSIQAGTTLFEENDISDGLYIVVSGLIEIDKNNKSKKITRNYPGQTIGSLTLGRLNKRSASAHAIEATTLIKFPKVAFDLLAEQRPDITHIIEQSLVSRTHRLHLGFVMRTNPMFTNLPLEVLDAIENIALITFVKNGDILWEQGNPSNYFYIVITGRLRIWHSSPTKIRSGLQKEIGPGETVGELGTITHEARKAGLRSLRDSTLACITREQLTELLTQYPEVMNTLLVRIVAHHFEAPRPKHEHAKNASNTIALIPINAGVSIGKIGYNLGLALAETGKTLVIDSTENDTLLGIPGFAQSSLDNPKNTTFFNWLNDLEFKHQHIILIADNSCSNWTRRCLHQADHLLFVANSDASPRLGSIEHELLTTENHLGIRKSLLLIHPKETKVPKNTQLWLSHRRIGVHYHLRRDHKKDFARLARFLTGRSVGLVLGGGAARGFAHIGVLRALEEKNIPIDLIGGTSMGALIAAQYAMQKDLNKITRSTLKLCLAGDKITIPLVSLYEGFKMAKGLKHLFRNSAIEDLWCRFYSVSCNLSRAKVMVHDSGPLLDAVIASNIPPGLFPPKVVNGDLLVDGALLNNVPVDIMTRYNEGGLLIAVDVNPKDDLLANTTYNGGLSGWQVLKSKLNPFKTKMQIPSILDVLMRSTSIGGLAQQKNVMTGIADFYLSPPVANYPLLAYKNADKIIEDSYQYTLKQIANWQFKL